LNFDKAVRERREEKKSRRTKKKKRSVMYAAIVVGVIIIGMSVFFVYSSEQAKIRGQAFGKAIEFLQEDLRKQTHMFDSKVSMFKDGNIGKDEFLEFAKNHENEMEKIILRYGNLQTPKPFMPSMELFQLSAEAQLESDKYIIEWVKTDDNSAHVRSDSLLQQAFEYEQAALYEFQLVQSKSNP